MSFIHRLCIILLVICHYVSLDTPKPEDAVNKLSHKENNDSEVTDGSSSETEKLDQPATFSWAQGIVPYYIDPESYDEIIVNRVRIAMKTIESVSCVIFKQIPIRPPKFAGFLWLLITNPQNERQCVHNTFLGNHGIAVAVLGYECMQRRDIVHMLLHVLGFRDEVTHPQRDMYIRVLWQNIQPKYRPLFRINPDEPPHKKMVEYDTMSIMHFHDRAYSSNGGATLAPLISGLLINPSDKLSQLDIMKLRLAFGHECNKRKVGNLFETCQNALIDDEYETSNETATDESYSEYSSGELDKVQRNNPNKKTKLRKRKKSPKQMKRKAENAKNKTA